MEHGIVMAGPAGEKDKAHQRGGQQHRAAHAQRRGNVEVDRNQPVLPVDHGNRRNDNGERDPAHDPHDTAIMLPGMRSGCGIIQG